MRNVDFARSRGRFVTDAGTNVHQLYSSYYDEEGRLCLEEVGTENTDDIIESYRASTELSVIISKFLNGDSSALNVHQGFYADLTQAPKTMRDALEVVMKAENAFNGLPLDVRQKFDNDWQSWLAQSGSDDWLKVMQPFSADAHANNDLNDNARVLNDQAASPPSEASS